MSENEKQRKVIVKIGQCEIIVPRDHIYDINETYDGLSINLMSKGSYIYISHQFLPQEAKAQITATFLNIQKGDITIDCNTPKTPIRVNMS